MPGSPMRAGVEPTSRACLVSVVRVSLKCMMGLLFLYAAGVREREGTWVVVSGDEASPAGHGTVWGLATAPSPDRAVRDPELPPPATPRSPPQGGVSRGRALWRVVSGLGLCASSLLSGLRSE